MIPRAEIGGRSPANATPPGAKGQSDGTDAAQGPLRNTIRPVYGYIYSVVCRTNNKGYIGQTTQSPDERWRQQDAKARKQTNGLTKRFHFALHEHGDTTFEFKVVDTATCHKELNEKERHLVARYRYDDPAYGYNSTAGGSRQRALSASAGDTAQSNGNDVTGE
jgi:GIY-YIG catalytic domain